MKRSLRSNLLKFALIILVSCGLVTLTLMVAYSLMTWGLRPADPASQETQLVTIIPGSGPGDIAVQLESLGIVRSSTAFERYVELTESGGSLQAGVYEFCACQSLPAIVRDLVAGNTAERDMLIIPGLRLDQIKVLFENSELEDPEAAFSTTYTSQVTSYIPEGKSLEGFIFPDTYRLMPGEPASALIERILAHFDSLLTPELLAGWEAQGLTPYEAVTLASIVQQEVSSEEEQRKVAQVFLKRLKMGMKLEADPTFRYAAALLDVEPSVNIDSPYNTRLHGGLPPTPIGSTGISALKAVAAPADSDFLYFVAGDDGTTHFSKTLEEHQENTRKYCTKLCQ